MVNLYDSPAQAQFINTYVPIQFEGLYKVADKAQKNLDEATAMEDDAITNYSTLNTPIASHRKAWDTNVYGSFRDLVNNTLTDPEALKDPVNQAKLKSAVRKMKSNPLAANLLISAQNAKAYIKASDPRWGDYEINKAKNFDPNGTGQLFEGSNQQYKSDEEIFEPLFKDLHPGGTDLGQTKGGAYDLKGWDKTHTDQKLVPAIGELRQQEGVQSRIDQMRQENTIPDRYYTTDKNTGVKSLDENALIYDMGRNIAVRHEWVNKTPNEFYLKRYEESLRPKPVAKQEGYTPNLNDIEQYSMSNQVAGALEDNAYMKLISNRILPGGKMQSYISKNSQGVPVVSKNNPMGIVGSEYARIRLNRDAVGSRLKQMAAMFINRQATTQETNEYDKVERNYKHLNQEFEPARKAFLSQVAAHRTLAENNVIDPETRRPMKSIFTKDDLYSSAKVQNSPLFINKQLTDALGNPSTVKTSTKVQTDLYPVKNSGLLTLIDPRNGRQIYTSDIKDNDVSKMKKSIESGKFSNAASFEPTTTSMKYSDRVDNIGSTYIRAGKFESEMYPQLVKDKDVNTLDKKIKKLTQMGLLSSEEVTVGTGPNATTETYYRIPTSIDLESPIINPYSRVTKQDPIKAR